MLKRYTGGVTGGLGEGSTKGRCVGGGIIIHTVQSRKEEKNSRVVRQQFP